MVSLDEAQEYDLFGYPETVRGDCDFMEAVFCRYGRRVKDLLDIACGTGRHAVEMARRGYRVTGVDLSGSMLRMAEANARKAGARIEFVQHDMTQLDLPGRFDAAYILFNTLMLLTRNEDLVRFMMGVHRALREEGLFIIQVGNLWPLIAAGKFANSTYRREEHGGEIRRVMDVSLFIGPHSNVYRQQRAIRYWRGAEELEPRAEVLDLRAFSAHELDLLCRLTHFETLGLYGATDLSARINDPSRIEEGKDPCTDLILVLRKGKD